MAETINLGYRPRPWQRDMHLGLDGKRFGVVVCHRRAGKSVAAVLHLIDRACRCTRMNGRYAYLAPELKQAKAIAWHYLQEYALKIPGTVKSEAELHVRLPNGAQIRIHGGDNPDSLRGLYLDGVVLDEAAQLKPELWDSVLLPLLADRQGWALFLGTPAGSNLLSDIYFRALSDPAWYCGLYDCSATNALPQSELDLLRKSMTDTAYRRELLCDFSAAADNQLMGLEEVTAAAKRHLPEGVYQHAAKIIGVDVARQGDDSSVIIRRQGLASWAPIVLRGANAMEVADRVAYEINEWQPDQVFVDGTGGYGAGVIDRLRQLGHNVMEVQFAGKPDSDKFANKRAEMWYTMAQWIRDGAAIAHDPELIADLTGPTYGFRNDGKLLLESKEDMKKRGRPSADRGDSLACSFAARVTPLNLAHSLAQVRSSWEREDSPRRAFDPLKRYGR